MIEKEFKIIPGTNIQYLLNKGKRKNSYIQIKNGEVIVKVPKSATQKYIDNFLIEKLNWIQKNLNKSKNTEHKLKYENGTDIFVLGKKLILIINFSNKVRRTRLENTGKELIIHFPNNLKSLSEDELKLKTKKVIDNYYKSIAKEEISSAMEDLKQRTSLSPLEWNIKNLKATWGICSSKRKISINQNLMAYSRHSIEYVCLHELCHLKYMNHSKEFWNLIEYYMPDYKTAKKELSN